MRIRSTPSDDGTKNYNHSMHFLTPALLCKAWLRACLAGLIALGASQGTFAQVCAAPGKDAPGAISGVVNTFYQGNGDLAAGASNLTLGSSIGAANTVSVGDMLMIIQMQGATINSTNSDAYGDGTASGNANSVTFSTTAQANGYTSLGQAGLFEYIRVTAATGSSITFTPPLTNGYQQNTTAQPRRTYQVIRVPQYPSASISAASPVVSLPWNGTTGGVVSIDVAGALSTSGSGAHINVSNQGFRGGAQGVANSTCCSNATLTYWFVTSNLTADGGGKGEGIAGTPRYLSLYTGGSFDSGTGFLDAVGFPASPNAILDLGAGNMGYPFAGTTTFGDFARGAPANAGGGGTSHNSGGGGGGNGGLGGNGGQTFNGDGLRDVGGFGGSRLPQSGSPVASRIYMGGGGGSGSLNNDSGQRGSGGYGGGIIVVRAGSISGSALFQSNGQKAIDSDAGQDAGGGGGAGGSVMVIASSGHGNVSAVARGGYGSNSNLNDGATTATYSNTAFAPPFGGSATDCCDGEREGPGGGGGGGVVMYNSPIGSTLLTRGINGLSREDKKLGNSGNMLAGPGTDGVQATVSSSSIAGVRPGYECLPLVTASKSTTTPARNVPPDTTGTYVVVLSNAATAGVAYAVGLNDPLSSPFTLSGSSATVTYGTGASGPASPVSATGTNTVIIGTAGNATSSFTLNPGSSLTVTFNVALNGAAAGTYQNPINLRFADPTRTSGGSALGTINATVTPGASYASGQPVGGSNYNAASSTQEDIVISGAVGTTADLVITKSGTAAAEVGQPVVYTLLVSNNGPANVPGTITVSDIVPANIGTVTWVCTLAAGTGDCDTSTVGAGSAGSGNTISLPRVSLNSGGQIQIVVSGTAITAGLVTNTATVSLPAGYNDPTPSNNRATATTTITTPSADLSITKTNNVSTVTSGGVTAYTIIVGNAGPSSANNAVITDPAATGLVPLSVACSAQGGAVCPVSLATSTFQTGMTITTFPAGGTLTFTLNAQVTASSGRVTNTVTIAAPAGTTDPTPANNAATDSDAVVAAVTRVLSSPTICPIGTTEQIANLISNGDFSNTSLGVGAGVVQAANDTYPADTRVALQSGAKNYVGGVVIQNPFPGDASRSVASTNNWLYSNGNDTGGAFRFWSQAVSGLMTGRTYLWMYYGSNTLASGNTTATSLPTIDFRVVTGTTTTSLGTADSYANEGAGVTDTWTLRQRTFTAVVNAVTLQLWDTVIGTSGDDFGSTQIQLRECRPNVDVFVTKTNGVSQVTALGTTAYVITVGNAGPGDADNVTVRDPVAVGLTKTGVSCAANGVGAACPPLVNVSGLEGSGLLIPTLPVNTTIVFTVTANVTALNGTVTNTVNLSLPAGVTDTNTANNSASDADRVQGQAAITIAKTNNTTTLVAGNTTSYTITVVNNGPSDASGSVLRDPVTPGLSCTTAAVCTASGGASCGAPSIPIATLQSGFTIPSFPSGGQLILNLVCGVTATGQ
jgi:uncharacterized repeat protein (TIGR01451 family)